MIFGMVETRRTRRWSWWLGTTLITAGVVILGYVAWQFWGTSWLSQRTQDRIVSEVEKAWDDPTVPAEQKAVNVEEGTASALIRVPRFGDDYVVPVLEGTSDQVLASGFGHFEDTVGPGEVGNYALAAHRITHGEPLRDMPSLRPGDEVIVETSATTYTYQLTSSGASLEVPFTAGWVLADLPRNPDPKGVQPVQEKGQRLITLTTCAELFHTDNRLVAFGVLTEKSPRQP
ncbi:MAG: class E sortase [Nocardioides sp.]|nr:class E sortase [Nocardioides sp.]